MATDLCLEGEKVAAWSARRRRHVRRAAATHEVPGCNSWTRRSRLEKDIFKWLQFYGGGTSFKYDFTPNQREIITAILTEVTRGGAQAIAASRGDGKSTITEWVLKYLILTGKARLVLYMASTEELSKKFVRSIQQRILKNERLYKDYPEVCGPVRDVAGNGSRAKNYVAYGVTADKKGEPFGLDDPKAPGLLLPFEWSTSEITFPEIPGSKAGGAKLVSGSLSGATRGFKDVDQRVSVIVLDDPDKDTRLTPETAIELERIIDSGLGFLGGQQQGLGRVMLTTVQGHFTVSAKFTDRKQKPAWHGRRFKFLEKPPDDMAKWKRYIELKELDWEQDTDHAQRYYLADRASMDAGAVLGNPNRFFAAQGEVSALQHYMNQVAEKGWEAVRREYDNQPPEEELPQKNGLTAHRIQRQLSGLPKRIVPASCEVLTRGIDINQRYAHWVVRAYASDGTCFTIDYGIEEVHNLRGTTEGLHEAIENALLNLFEEETTDPYVNGSGTPVPIRATCVDSRYEGGAVRQAVKKACELWGTRYYTVQGCGMGARKGTRCTKPSYREILNNHNPDRTVGDGWHMDRITGICSEIKIDKERFVRYEQARWMLDGPGANYLWGEKETNPDAIHLSRDSSYHQSFARHIVNEYEEEKLEKGVMVKEWKSSKNVHYLDSACYATAAALKCGIALPSFQVKKGPKKMVDPNFMNKVYGG